MTAVLDELTAHLLAEPDPLVHAVLSGISGEVPAYRSLSPDEWDVVSRGVTYAVRKFVELLAERRRPSSDEFDDIAAIGVVRGAQGIPLDGIAAATRAGLRWGWAYLLFETGLATSPCALKTLEWLGPLAFDYTQMASAALLTGASGEAIDRLDAEQRARGELIEHVLFASSVDHDSVVRLGAALRLDFEASHLFLQLASDRVAPLRSASEALLAASPQPLSVSLRGNPILHMTIVLDAHDPNLVEHAAAVAHSAGVLVAVPPAVDSLAGLRQAYLDARATLSLALRLGFEPGLVPWRSLASARLITLIDPQTARDFVDEILGPVLVLSRNRRERLLQALTATLWSEGRRTDAGARIGVHGKTVTLRLRDVERHTGLSILEHDSRLLLELAVMLHALHDQ
ncbi:MAG TPA: helix-turn-helix domain-containing protein [Acidimicrobiales bacterium]|nr:helix-turn-helix domain-containing protein [Acidimicrobiales bacterium]